VAICILYADALVSCCEKENVFSQTWPELINYDGCRLLEILTRLGLRKLQTEALRLLRLRLSASHIEMQY